MTQMNWNWQRLEAEVYNLRAQNGALQKELKQARQEISELKASLDAKVNARVVTETSSAILWIDDPIVIGGPGQL